jgi:hypothetical protein
MIDVAGSSRQFREETIEQQDTYLTSHSFPVLTSVIINRTHGGGVIGRRS